jgi:RND family efflux transporter MFP subunit
MKIKYLLIAFLILLLAACGTQENTNELPEDLTELRNLYTQKKKESQDLQNTIAEIEAKLDDLDPTRKVQLIPVSVIPVTQGVFEKKIGIQGSIASKDVVFASSETGGRLVSVSIREGQNVKRGQVIARVDLEAINKQMDEVKTSLKLAEDVYQRQKRLWDQNIGSEVQFLQAKNTKERLEMSLETLRFQLSKNKVYAPISGQVDKVMLKSGEISAPGMPIAQIISTRTVKMVANIPEKYLRSVRKGDKVKIEIPALGIEKVVPISLIGTSINPDNRTFALEVNLSNPTGQLKPNLLAIVEIVEYKEEDVIMMPLDLVQEEVGGKKFIYTIVNEGADMVAKKHFLTLGESADNKVIVKEGLTLGDQIVSEGSRSINENDLVEIKAPFVDGQ